MNNKQQFYILDRPYIASNPYGGVVTLTWEDDQIIAEIEVHQNEIYEEAGKIKRSKRKGYMGGSIDDILSPDTHYYPGERISGKCVIIESYEPPVPDDPEAFLKIDKQGNIVRINGRCVYQLEIYTYNALEADIFITE